MEDIEGLLAALQNADSFFPGGGIAFSWGLETLIADVRIRRDAQIAAFVSGQLRSRWATSDRPVLVAAYRARTWREVLHADSTVEAMTLARELREGSRRAGISLLTVHERLGTPGAGDYRAEIRAGAAYGHLAVVQGVLWRGAGLTESGALAASAHTFCVSLLGAALRLGAIGHLQSQQILAGARDTVRELLREPALPVDAIYATTPEAEIAAMRHEVQSGRLFAN